MMSKHIDLNLLRIGNHESAAGGHQFTAVADLLNFDEKRLARSHFVGENRKEVSQRQVIHIHDPLVLNMYGATVVRRTREDLCHPKIHEDRLIPGGDHRKTLAASLLLQ